MISQLFKFQIISYNFSLPIRVIIYAENEKLPIRVVNVLETIATFAAKSSSNE